VDHVAVAVDAAHAEIGGAGEDGFRRPVFDENDDFVVGKSQPFGVSGRAVFAQVEIGDRLLVGSFLAVVFRVVKDFHVGFPANRSLERFQHSGIGEFVSPNPQSPVRILPAPDEFGNRFCGAP
jgi:hypothetical protein